MSYGSPGTVNLMTTAPRGVAPMSLPKVIRRIGEQALWSSQRYADAAVLASTSDRIFTSPRGQVAQGFAAALTLPETNLKEAGRIPGGQAYDVFGIACQTYYQGNAPIVADDVRNLLNNSVLSWDFLQTLIEVAPTMLIGAGGGAYGDTADTGAADGAGGSRTLINNGTGQIWVYRETPVVLASNTTFAVVIAWGADAAVVDGGAGNDAQIVRVCLMGRYQTAIAVG